MTHVNHVRTKTQHYINDRYRLSVDKSCEFDEIDLLRRDTGTGSAFHCTGVGLQRICLQPNGELCFRELRRSSEERRARLAVA